MPSADAATLHARLVAEIRRRLEVCEAQTPGPWEAYRPRKYTKIVSVTNCERRYVTDTFYGMPGESDVCGMVAQRNERPAELRAALAIAEIHVPHASLIDAGRFWCGVCRDDEGSYDSPCLQLAILADAYCQGWRDER